jgi:Phosphotransferase enzyme family
VPLLGGDVTEGLVRAGLTVRRPRGPEALLVEALLRHVERIGFTGAPRFLGVDVRGRQVLSWVEGEVAARPWPSWVADEERIVSVAELVRGYDDAAQSFRVSDLARAATPPDLPGMPPRLVGPAQFVGHQDITPENVVFRGGRAAALIDFDLARLTDRPGEVANVLLWWAPLMPRPDREPVLREVNAHRRAALIVDAYGLGADDRARVIATARNDADRAWYSMRDRAERLGGGWRRMWEDGVGERILRRQAWLAENAASLEAAVVGAA